MQDCFVQALSNVQIFPEHIIVAHEDSNNNLTGAFLEGGCVFDFAYNSTNKEITIQENRQDSEFVADYVSGVLAINSIRCDSENSYEWLKGFLLEERLDFGGRLKCGLGTIPCGEICLPRGKQCRISKGKAIIEKRKNQAIAREVSKRKHPDAKNVGDLLMSEARYRLSGKSNRERAEHMTKLKTEVTKDLSNKMESQKQKEIDKITRNQRHKGKLPGVGVIQGVAERLTTDPEEIVKKEAPFREKAQNIHKIQQERIAERAGGGVLTAFSKAKEAVVSALRKRKAS